MEEKLFDSFDMRDEHGKLTNAGALLADDSPIRHSRLFCTRWNGLDKSGGMVDALDSAEYSGSLIILLNEGVGFVKRNMKTRWKKTADSRIEMPDYCERSVFEAIVNALIHRDYLILGSEVHIDIYDDRLTIYSPGGMPDGTRIQERDLSSISSTRRNPVLADIFGRLGYMERQGSGFKKITETYRAAHNYRDELEPKFYSEFCSNFSFSSSVRRTLIRTFSSFILSSPFFSGVFRGAPPERSACRKAADPDCGGHNPMLAIPVDTAFSLPLPPNVVFLSLPRSFTAALPCSLPAGEVFARSYPIRTVIQFSICPSIGRQREGPKINPVCKFFELCLQRQKEPVHSTSNQREKISRHIFDETMYRLCFSETFNVCFFRSAGRLSNRSGTAAIPFDGCLVFHSDIQLWLSNENV